MAGGQSDLRSHTKDTEMETSFICNDDVPENVRQRIHLLYAKEAHMRMLEAQMRTLREEINLLHVKLSRYSVMDDGEDSGQDQASHRPVRYTKRGTPIHQCPDEILGMIFSQYLYYDHMEIWVLLFVCKRWNYLIMNSPTLWACIEIPEGRFLFDLPPQSSKRVYTYIAACLQRSNELPIHVRLDLTNIPSWTFHWIRDVISQSPVRNNTTLADLLDWADDWDIEDYDDEVKKVFGRFASLEGAHIERWGSLSIKMEDNTEFGYDMWNYFLPVAPKLKVVSMNNCPEEWLGGYKFDPDIPEFSTARSLSLPFDISLHNFKASPAHLRHLEIGIAYEDRALKDIALFHLLESLILHGNLDESVRDFSTFRIHLPLLKDFCLLGNYTIFKRLDMDFPNLSRLSLRHTDGEYDVPDYSLLYLQWDNSESYDAKYCEPLLYDFLPRFSTVQVLTLPHFTKKTALTVITEWKAAGKIPNLWQLRLENFGGNIKEHDIFS